MKIKIENWDGRICRAYNSEQNPFFSEIKIEQLHLPQIRPINISWTTKKARTNDTNNFILYNSCPMHNCIKTYNKKYIFHWYGSLKMFVQLQKLYAGKNVDNGGGGNHRKKHENKLISTK